MLKTAATQVRAGTISREANILLDEGAKRSFIIRELANELGAKPDTKENISMSAFGAKEHTLRKLDVTTVEIVTDEDNKIPLRILVVPNIATPLQCKHQTDISNLP